MATSSMQVSRSFTTGWVRVLWALALAVVLALAPALNPTPAAAATYPFGTPRQIGHGWNAERTFSPGDWNKDGRPDLMLITPTGELMFYAATSAEKFARPVQVGHGWTSMDLVAGGLDWNGDGNPDLIARRTDGILFAYYGNGRGGFQGSAQIGHGWSGMKHIVPISSYGNGVAVVATNADGRMIIYPASGGRFRPKVELGYGWNGARVLASAGDWNGDGRQDLLAIMDSGDLRLYAGTASGFSSAKIGHGWFSFSRLAMGPIAGSNGTLWGVKADGTLWAYPVRVTAPAPPPPPPPPPTPTNPALFAYGTLRQDASAFPRYLAGRVSSVQVDRLPWYSLYVYGSRSTVWAVPSSSNRAGILGEKMHIIPSMYAGTIASIDRYESYYPANPSQSLYLRELRQTASGEWVHVYVAAPRLRSVIQGTGTWIRSGDYFDYFGRY